MEVGVTGASHSSASPVLATGVGSDGRRAWPPEPPLPQLQQMTLMLAATMACSGEAGARLLAARRLDAERTDRRDAAINAETMEEIRGRQADEREARTSQELVVGPSRGPTQAPNAGEPGFSE